MRERGSEQTMSSISKKKGIDVREQSSADKDLFTALENDNYDGIKRALEAGADPNAKNACGEPAVLIAVHIKSNSALKQLIDAGANVNKINRGGWAPIYEAVWGRDTQAIRMLIDAGADLDQREEGGWTPLMALMASAYSHEVDANKDGTKHMLMLIEAGADAGIKNRDGDTAFDVLKKRHPKFYDAHIEELKAALPEAKRLKREDSAGYAETGYEFDI